jgi:hypothetical protein
MDSVPAHLLVLHWRGGFCWPPAIRK